MAHRTARLNQFGRQLLIDRVLGEGWTVATAAEAQGISRATGHKWVRRFRLEGAAGLVDRSSRPRRSPRATPAHEVQRIIAARQAWRWGPDRLGPLLGLPPSTVGSVLRRSGLPHLADIDRPTGLPVRRYEVCHPGALVHQDHKKLGRIPDGGGHRSLGRSTEARRRKGGLGYDHFEVIVDDRSRRSVVVHVPDETGASAATALAQALAVFAADGIAVERVLTDNGVAYRSTAYRAVLGERRHSRTRPYRPQTNGKAERFIGTLIREWAYARPYRSNIELPVRVDADDVGCRHVVASRVLAVGGRDRATTSQSRGSTLSSGQHGPRVTMPGSTLQAADSHHIEVAPEISFESGLGTVTHVRAAVAAFPARTSPTPGSPC